MNLRSSRLMILGGSGLVGRAVARRVLAQGPSQIVLVARTERESADAAAAIAAVAGETQMVAEFGDIFLPAEVAQLPPETILEQPQNRRLVLDDLLGEMTEDVLARSQLYRLLDRYRPDAVVDCVNTATAFAYQDVFSSAQALRRAAERGRADLEAVERHLLTLPLPALVRHLQIAAEAMRRAGTRAYVKIGTSGTGGMGLNIPYTHSETRPSRMLLGKAALGGAHTLLLFLLGRTPEAPAAIEIKPTATIAWREIGWGPIRRGAEPIPLVDCREAIPLECAFGPDASGWVDLGRPLESVFIDVGENGLFAREEFETVTALGQMEFITPEEIADYVVMELNGYPTGRNLVALLDAGTAGPTYQAGMLRQAACERLAALESERGVRSVAFETLGPPRLTKLLYEAHIFSCLLASVAELAAAQPQALAQRADALVAEDGALRRAIVSVGVPIIRADGARVYRGPRLAVPPADGDPLAAAAHGWVDLRAQNCAVWVDRARSIVAEAAARAGGGGGGGSGSDEPWGAIVPAEPIRPSRLVTWIFAREDRGARIKR